MKKEYILEGLCCGNCAAKIERDIGKIGGVSFAAVDFVSKTLTMEIAEGTTVNSLAAQADAIVRRHDSQVVVKENSSSYLINSNSLAISKFTSKTLTVISPKIPNSLPCVCC
ncbi:heavy-metal-associated domain-containing protein [Aminipila butyrica]|nr:heavy-metal-associated domain-containing protein [Aminipila butyrica]